MVSAKHEAAFPLCAAGIDVGSNALRLLAAEFSTPDTWTILALARVPVRLGAAVFDAAEEGVLPPDVIEAAVVALETFRARMDSLGIEVYRAAATSAVREATNGSELVRLVAERTGIRLEPIAADDEARLVWRAVATRLDVHEQEWLLIDVGGGSVEIARTEGEAVVSWESHAMGAVRLLAQFEDSTGSPHRFRQLAQEHIDTLMSQLARTSSHRDGVVATGGNIEELARLGGARTTGGVARLPTRTLAELIDRLAELTPQQRVEQLRLRPDRADVILPAALVYERIAHSADVDELIVPYVGLKEGLLLDAMRTAVRRVEPGG